MNKGEKMVRTAVLLALFIVTLLVTNCRRISPDSISEVVLKENSGLGRTDFTVEFHRDGRAQCRCLFFWLSKEPESNLNTFCGRLLSRSRSSFTKTPESFDSSQFRLEGIFTGQVSKEQFDQLAKLIVENGYFSMKDEYIDREIMDAPPTMTRVVYPGGAKEIRNQLGKGGKRLSDIEGAISKAAEEIEWKGSQD